MKLFWASWLQPRNVSDLGKVTVYKGTLAVRMGETSPKQLSRVLGVEG